VYLISVSGWLQLVHPSLFSGKACQVLGEETSIVYLAFLGFPYAGRMYRLMNSASDVLFAISM
jgi:hypothetical protein